MIRLTVPSIEQDDLESVQEVLRSGYLVQGKHVEAFEQCVADYVGARHAVAVTSGTAALHLSLLGLNVGPGDLVLVAAYSFVATANVIELCGARPVFVDIQADTFNMDPDRLHDALRKLLADPDCASRVKAVLPVHSFGLMADMPRILELAAQHDLPVVEDAACALGAALGGKKAGTWGRAGCFSFHPRKAITTGEGGMIVTGDGALANRLRALRNHGQDPEASSADFILPGFNYRMTEFQAALGMSQMAKLSRILDGRRAAARRYDALLRGTPIRTPLAPEDTETCYQSYVVLLPPKAAVVRANLIRQLKERGVETTLGTWHMPLTTYYRTRYGYRLGDFPVADQIFSRSLALPLYESLKEENQVEVVRCMKEVLAKAH